LTAGSAVAILRPRRGGAVSKATTDPINREASIQTELSRLYGLIETDTTTSILQYMALVLTAGVLAAKERSDLFIAVPVAWSVWLLHGVVLDINTMKYSAIARHLEKMVPDIFLYESHLAHRANVSKRPPIMWVFYAYLFVMNTAAWGVASYFIWEDDPRWLLYIVGGIYACVWGFAGYSMLRRSHYMQEFEAAIKNAPTPPLPP
jgi:hypothetical protein